MTEKLEWELVPRVKESEREAVEGLAEEALRLDAMMEVAPHRLTRADQDRLVELQRNMEECVVLPCEAAEAPQVGSRPDWGDEVKTLYEELEDNGGLTLQQFREHVETNHDCTRCPGAFSFPGVSGMPCDFELAPLLGVLVDDDLKEQVQFELAPSEMTELAEALELQLRMGSFLELEDRDTKAYLADAIGYLRFWSEAGFGVAPAFVNVEESE